MNWLALSPLEVAAVWAGLAALALWLYLHHRRPQHKKVSTLRFWASVQPISQPRRRKLREPWAYVAQALFLLLLILALANLRLGFTLEGRNVVIVLDTSIWSQARSAGGAPWIEREREEALRILGSLPGSDRVLLLRAEANAPPILSFTTDRAALRRAVANAQPSSGPPDVPHALEIGKTALNGSRQGLLVYVGPGMLDEQQEHNLQDFRAEIEAPADNNSQPQFLVRLAGEDAPVQDRGITRLSLRRDATEPDHWHLLTQLKNYGDARADVVLKLSIDGEPLGQRTVALAPGELANAENEFTWDKGGTLQADISPPDALEADNHAILNLPEFRTVQVAVFADSASPFATDLLSVLSSNPYVQTQTIPPGSGAIVSPDVAIYQGTSLPSQPAFNSIWFLSGSSTAASRPLRITQWNSEHPVTRWVRTHDVSVRNPAKLSVLPGDTVLASTEGDTPAPLILAREQNGHKILIIGFDPHDSNFPLESAFPLLMAGAIEWMTHSVDEAADSFATGELDLPGPVTRIVGPSGKDVPFARKGADVHWLALQTGIYRVIAPGGETTIAVNTPLLPARRLTVTPVEAADVESEPFQPAEADLWRWLVILGIAALWLEWWLYYSSRERQRSAEIGELPGDDPSLSADRELEDREESESRKSNLVV
jgi:Ca-activated chloride channel homolog